MQVILKENVPGLGHTGELVKVNSGYARNFLFPKSLAIVATPKNVGELEHHRKSLAVKLAKEKNIFLELSKKVSDVKVTIKRRAGDNEKIFGSVSNQDIAVELRAAGFEVDRKQIHLEEPIRNLGVHEVNVKLHPDVKTILKVWVIADETLPKVEEEKVEKPKKGKKAATEETNSEAKSETETKE